MINEYVNICRCLGGWTDWVQGAGGNCSVKEGNSLIIKKSGARIADATTTNGWVLCDLSAVKQCIIDNNENVTSTVIQGEGKPSIEAFIHTLDARIIVHLHPYPLTDMLCSDSFTGDTDTYKILDYYKPGLPLATELQKIFNPDIKIYFFKQHGVLFLGDSMEEIIIHMKYVYETFCSKNYLTDISMCYSLYSHMLQKYNKSMIIKPFLYNSIKTCERVFFPYTPDILIFLQSEPFFIESSTENPCSKLDKYISKHGMFPTILYKAGVTYLIATTLIGCFDLQDIIISYFNIHSKSNYLNEEQISELIHWDKEKERKAMNG